MSPVEPQEPDAGTEANQLQADPISAPGSPAEPEPTQDLGGSPAGAGHVSEARIEADRPEKPTDPFATTLPSEPMAATRSFEPVGATRAFEPVGATRAFEPVGATRAFEPVGATRQFETYEPRETHAPDQTNEPYERSGPMPQDDLRQHQDPVSRSAGQRPPATPTRAPDVVSIAAGVVFFALGGAYLLAASGHLAVNAAWTVSLLFIGLGLSGFLGAAINSHRRRSR